MKHGEKKVRGLNEIIKISKQARAQGRKVVTTNGTFDIIHVGHVRNLKTAKSHGDILIVGVNSDASVKKYKGKHRPVVPAAERAEVLASLSPVDYVFIFDSETPIPWLKKIRPHVHAKGADRKISQIIEKQTLDEIGAKFVRIPYHKGKPTTNIIEKIKRL